MCGWTFGEKGEQGGLHVENMATPGGLGAGRAGNRAQFWLRVANLEESLQKIQEAGGTTQAPEQTPEGIMVSCQDDQGVVFNIAQPASGL